MLKLIAVNYTVMLNGYSQWLNIKGEKQFHRDISSRHFISSNIVDLIEQKLFELN